MNITGQVSQWQSVLAVDSEVICSEAKWSMEDDKSIFIRSVFFLHGTSLVNITVINKRPTCRRTLIMGVLIWFAVQNSTNAWNVLSHAAGVIAFSDTFGLYFIFNRIRNVFEVLSTKAAGLPPRLQGDAPGEACGSESEK